MEQITIREENKREVTDFKKNNALADFSDEVLNFDFIQSNMDSVLWCKLLADYGEMITFADQLDKILPGSSYILDIPGSVLEGVSGTAADFVSKMAGDVVANIFEKTGTGNVLKNSIPFNSSVNIDDRTLIDLNNSLQHLAVQQQMAAFASEIEETHEAIRRIESGLNDDRFGEIIGARNQLYLASKAKDKDNRKVLTQGAIQQLSVGVGKVSRALERKVHEFEPIPKNRLLLYWRMASSVTDYAEQKDNEYNEIKEYVDLYREANNLMAAAYMMIDEPELAQEVYEMQGEFWKGLDMKNVQSIGNMHTEADLSKEWCFNPSIALNEAKTNLLESAANKYNRISVEITGQQLLEVFGHDQHGQSEGTPEK